jgi:hypothetical protein
MSCLLFGFLLLTSSAARERKLRAGPAGKGLPTVDEERASSAGSYTRRGQRQIRLLRAAKSASSEEGREPQGDVAAQEPIRKLRLQVIAAADRVLAPRPARGERVR